MLRYRTFLFLSFVVTVMSLSIGSEEVEEVEEVYEFLVRFVNRIAARGRAVWRSDIRRPMNISSATSHSRCAH